MDTLVITKHLLISFLSVLCISNCYAQNVIVSIHGDVQINMSGKSNLVVSGENSQFAILTEQVSNFSLDPESTLHLEGHFQSGEDKLDIAGTMIIDGNERQQLNGNLSVRKLDLANSEGLELNGNLYIKDTLEFIEGKIFTSNIIGDDSLIIPVQAPILNADTNRFVSGLLYRQTDTIPKEYELYFPIGKDLIYKPASLHIIQKNAQSYLYKAEVFSSNVPMLNLPQSLENVSPTAYWHIEQIESENVEYTSITLEVLESDSVPEAERARIASAQKEEWKDLGGVGLPNIPGKLSSFLPPDSLGIFTIATAPPNLSIDSMHYIDLIDASNNPNQENNEVWVEINNPSFLKEADFIYKKISVGKEDSTVIKLNLREDRLNFELKPEDHIGIEYYFRLQSFQNRILETPRKYAHLDFKDGLTFQDLLPGTKKDDYRVISIPLKLDNGNVLEMLKILGDYDPKKWRLYKVDSNGLLEFSGFEDFKTGQAYLLIFNNRPRLTFNTGGGTTALATFEEPFSLQLHHGWNFIASPYRFNLSWEDIKTQAQKDSVILRSEIYTYSPNWDVTPGDKIKQREGVLIFCENENARIKIPAKLNSAVQRKGRLSSKIENPINEEHWEVLLRLEGGGLRRTFSGIGMRSDASEGTDEWDVLSPISLKSPTHLGGYLDMHFYHSDYSYPYFSKDLVPNQNTYVWDFNIVSSINNDPVSITWDNSYFGMNDQQLILYDVVRDYAIDMRKQNMYIFSPQKPHPFKLYYGSFSYITQELGVVEIDNTPLGLIYPNPFSQQITIPISLPSNSQGHKVLLEIWNPHGQKIKTLIDANLAGGSYDIFWDATTYKGQKVTSGLYYYHLLINNQYYSGSIVFNGF